jgi:hypothetical protein
MATIGTNRVSQGVSHVSAYHLTSSQATGKRVAVETLSLSVKFSRRIVLGMLDRLAGDLPLHATGLGFMAFPNMEETGCSHPT